MSASSALRRSAQLLLVLPAALASIALAAPSAGAAPTAAAAAPAAAPAGVHTAGGVNLGRNVYVFTPAMTQARIQNTVNAIAAQQVGNQFGTERYALLFEPGTYGTPSDPLIFQVGYYTEVAGLGRSPDDTVINGSIDVYNQCDSGGCTALDNFWRSLTNLHINVAGGSGCQANTEFWAVSQAAPMRRVDVTGATTLMDYCTGPSYASGGFIADSRFGGNVVNGSQQQFFVRNSALNGWTNGVWNQVFLGDTGAPAEDFPGGNQYTTIGRTPLDQEEPYLYLDNSGALAVWEPALTSDTTGPSWTSEATPGVSVPAASFFVVRPVDTASRMNQALAAGDDLLVTPGVYDLGTALQVTRANTVVLGMGMATFTPTSGKAAMVVSGVPGVKISGLIFDANLPKSSTLLTLAPSNSAIPNSPDLLQDVFFRVGGAQPGAVGTALQVNASDVVLDDVWSWRADHGAGVGWIDNTANTGVAVNGAHVRAYGLFVEHYQKNEIVWNGAQGSIYMLQNEMPYDVPSQTDWMSSSRIKGYPALRVTPDGTGFRGYGLGSYCFFNQGVDIHASEAFSYAVGADERVHDALTVFLNGSGGIDSVVNGVGGPVSASNPSTPSDVVG